ncbi:Polysaccharide biosynthesis protein [Candidatus Protochlamydia naegleriophila]|uniref:Polysaccharide biosynthesis protein n=1 Tax=Candidatus Protochlamydia naegleriophila TaxID=389348 RepID=A0A0U5JAC6_9BACT|nr:UDP-N-acetylglucosamine 4,6-dehydratase (inverting) [Candidatus Protochlamydia naegleriophila]CUI16029.1 Polysaccharide biosynthesis protein [Candidatus Protochlamydia naegleriophila]
MSSIFTDQSILITGGSGSFGRALAKRILKENTCRKVIIFSRDEWKQWEMRRSDPIFDHPKIRYFLGDVRDSQRLMRAFKDVTMIVHAAALKQVPAAEYNPSEFIKTNIMGAMNVIDAAINCGVQRVIALSTDKAVNPVNLYGATKLCSDKLFVAGNSYVGAQGFPSFSVVRYGNVAASRGSIIPFWQTLIQQGIHALPITDERMTRFWITLEESVDFVCHCFQIMKGGEIFIPKIPSIKILDLADALAPHLPKEICGIRPGEKLNELMISSDDARHTVEFDRHYVIMPELIADADERIPSEHTAYPLKGKPVLPDFVYASHTNSKWLTVEEIRQFLAHSQAGPL